MVFFISELIMSEVSAKSEIFLLKKVPATFADFDFFFPKYPRFWKLKLEYFPIKKVFRKTAKYGKLSFFKLIMSEVSKDLRNIFFTPPILKVEVGFFSDRIFFFTFFPNCGTFICCKLIMSEVSAKSEDIFFAEKSASYLWGFWFFFSKIPPILKLEVGFFST